MNKKHNAMKNCALAHLWAKSMMLAGAGVLLLSACAVDGFDDDERFESGTKGQSLASPSAEDITVTPSADGKSQTIAWKVVQGAGGYLVNLIDEGNPEAPIVKDSLVDGCSMTVKREEDVNYLLTIQTQGNEKLGNTAASEQSRLAFNTFAVAYATIPDGTDLYEYFQQNPIPESDEMLYYDLAPGGSYTLSDVLDLSNHSVVLRTTSKTNHATITYGATANIEYCGGLGLKYLNFDCAETAKSVLAFSATPAEGMLDAANNNHNQIRQTTSIQNCNFTGVKHEFLFDNKVKYCLKTFYMENCLVHFESETMSTSSYFMIYGGGGFINDFTIDSSTLWNTGTNAQYMIRYGNAGRCDRAGYTSNSINFHNCTLYNISRSGQMANHSGFDGRATSNYDITDNIFVECGNGAVPRRITGRINTAAVNNFSHNTYWFNGAPETEGFSTNTYDQSGNALQTDPDLTDPEGGNFTPRGAEQLANRTGDPRWLP